MILDFQQIVATVIAYVPSNFIRSLGFGIKSSIVSTNTNQSVSLVSDRIPHSIQKNHSKDEYRF